MYPAEMEESIAKVVATRERRLKEVYPPISDEEKKSLLERFHPDFVSEGMRELQVHRRSP